MINLIAVKANRASFLFSCVRAAPSGVKDIKNAEATAKVLEPLKHLFSRHGFFLAKLIF